MVVSIIVLIFKVFVHIGVYFIFLHYYMYSLFPSHLHIIPVSTHKYFYL